VFKVSEGHRCLFDITRPIAIYLKRRMSKGQRCVIEDFPSARKGTNRFKTHIIQRPIEV